METDILNVFVAFTSVEKQGKITLSSPTLVRSTVTYKGVLY